MTEFNSNYDQGAGHYSILGLNLLGDIARMLSPFTVLPELQTIWNLSTFEIALLGASSYAGFCIGGIFVCGDGSSTRTSVYGNFKIGYNVRNNMCPKSKFC